MGIIFIFFSWSYLDVSVHSVNSICSIYSSRSILRLIKMGFPIRKSPDQKLFALTRGLSQLITSFIVSMCLGIPRTLLVALPKCRSWRWLGYIESPDRWFNLSNFQIVKKQKFLMLWSWQGSNVRPPECKSGALPTELKPQFFWLQLNGGPAWTRTTDLCLIRAAL